MTLGERLNYVRVKMREWDDPDWQAWGAEFNGLRGHEPTLLVMASPRLMVWWERGRDDRDSLLRLEAVRNGTQDAP